MDKIKPLFTATATAVGGRNGHFESSDGMRNPREISRLRSPKPWPGTLPGLWGVTAPQVTFSVRAGNCTASVLDTLVPFTRSSCAK
jgi:hypothetical protein